MVFTSFSLAVTANMQSKMLAFDSFSFFASLKTSNGATPEGFIFSISLHSQRSTHKSAASRVDRGFSTLFG